MKAFVIALTAIVVAAILVMVYGSQQPSGGADGAHGGVDRGFGWLVPDRPLSIDDLDAPCLDESGTQLVVAGSGTCGFDVPDPASLLLCSDAETPIEVTTDGEEYPAQTVSGADVTCGSQERIPIYDTATTVTIRCLAPSAVACRVSVLQPEG